MGGYCLQRSNPTHRAQKPKTMTLTKELQSIQQDETNKQSKKKQYKKCTHTSRKQKYWRQGSTSQVIGPWRGETSLYNPKPIHQWKHARRTVWGGATKGSKWGKSLEGLNASILVTQTRKKWTAYGGIEKRGGKTKGSRNQELKGKKNLV